MCPLIDPELLQDINTFGTYTGKTLEGQTIKTRRNSATFYFLSNNVELKENDHYGFNCTYKFR